MQTNLFNYLEKIEYLRSHPTAKFFPIKVIIIEHFTTDMIDFLRKHHYEPLGLFNWIGTRLYVTTQFYYWSVTTNEALIRNDYILDVGDDEEQWRFIIDFLESNDTLYALL